MIFSLEFDYFSDLIINGPSNQAPQGARWQGGRKWSGANSWAEERNHKFDPGIAGDRICQIVPDTGPDTWIDPMGMDAVRNNIKIIKSPSHNRFQN